MINLDAEVKRILDKCLANGEGWPLIRAYGEYHNLNNSNVSLLARRQCAPGDVVYYSSAKESWVGISQIDRKDAKQILKIAAQY